MIDLISNFHFIRPVWLFLIPVAITVWWLWRKQMDPLRGWRRQVVPELLDALVLGRAARRNDRASLLLVVWLLAAVAIAGPTWRPEPNPFAGDAAPLMVLLKADASMDRPVPAPSIIERAHLKLADLAEVRRGEAMGLIAYAGSSHLVLPPTVDTAVVASMATEVSSSIMPVPGDRLDLALTEANELLAKSENGGSILVIADSVTDVPRVKNASQETDRFPVQFLALTNQEDPDYATLLQAAESLGGTVRSATIDDGDVLAVTKAAASYVMTGTAGATDRWQDAGYFLVLPIALIAAFSFRRESRSQQEQSE
ncbi:VWA domain-containing protein [Rubripirellula sp.]|nr:VWA domain-containing protein [Rubripirellula sp.]MDF1843540.1 VWA domain-containing protein [Rubripirellula sp.]